MNAAETVEAYLTQMPDGPARQYAARWVSWRRGKLPIEPRPVMVGTANAVILRADLSALLAREDKS